jgi:hypothetical protein
MTALAKLKTPLVEPDQKPDNVLIHVRFHPNAEIFTIDKCPEHVSSRDWFNRLREGAPETYQVLAGGRGFFRIPSPRFEAILSQGVK